MYSDNEKVVLCGASAYEQKYYFNQDFASLPQSVQDELHVMCVMFTVEIGGIFTMIFLSTYGIIFKKKENLYFINYFSFNLYVKLTAGK